MFDRFKKFFASHSDRKHPLWEVMEEMDPLLSYRRFQRLKLTGRQRPMVEGLIDGSLKPENMDAVQQWKQQFGEQDDGIDALVFALQHVMEGTKVTYLFEQRALVPTARFPNFVNERALTVLYNDRENRLQITSLQEFVASNQITNYTLEALDPRQLRNRMTGRNNPTPAMRNQQSVTIEMNANSAGELDECVGTAAIASALNQAGFKVDSAAVCLESRLEKFGLHKVNVQLDPDTNVRVFVWVVPSVAPEEKR